MISVLETRPQVGCAEVRPQHIGFEQFFVLLNGLPVAALNFDKDRAKRATLLFDDSLIACSRFRGTQLQNSTYQYGW
jgi:hypothetical protein